MNKERRKKIQSIIAKLSGCSEELGNVREDEDYSRESIPENLQGSTAYCESEEISDKIEDAITDIEQAVDTLEEI